MAFMHPYRLAFSNATKMCRLRSLRHSSGRPLIHVEQLRAKPAPSGPFHLPARFVNKYRNRRPPFGFNGLGAIVYLRTYARLKADGQSEEWVDTIQRVVEGVTEILRRHTIDVAHEEWNEEQELETAKDMFDRMFKMKFLPPGRGLWAMGTSIITDRKLGAALNNCGFVSTRELGSNRVRPFEFLMDMLMLGVGVGFDTAGANSFVIPGPSSQPKIHYCVPDERQGWVESVRLLLSAHFDHNPDVSFDYSAIRAAGVPLKGYGGVSCGSQPLKDLHRKLSSCLQGNVNKPISVTLITDLMNLIGTHVVAGGIRRAAEIAFGDPNSSEFLSLKDYQANPQREAHGWVSNNTIFATLGMDYTPVVAQLLKNGEPGIAWLQNMQGFSRMVDPRDDRDARVAGGPPCLEQTLESMELCCLAEVFPASHEDYQDFAATLRHAYRYAKAATLVPIHWEETQEIMQRNRRIGCSVSGIAQFLAKHTLQELQTWLEDGYQLLRSADRELSAKLRIAESIKITTVKPSGTISLVAGATPGIHFPTSRFYIRRVRIAANSPLVPRLRHAGYHVEACQMADVPTVVVEVPVDGGEGVRTLDEVTMMEQLELVAFVQKYWSDNQVSATVTFDRETEGPKIAGALQEYQYKLKGVSFMPKEPVASFAQMPYEAISEEEYQKRAMGLSAGGVLSVSGLQLPDAPPSAFCDTDRCKPDV